MNDQVMTEPTQSPEVFTARPNEQAARQAETASEPEVLSQLGEFTVVAELDPDDTARFEAGASEPQAEPLARVEILRPSQVETPSSAPILLAEPTITVLDTPLELDESFGTERKTAGLFVSGSDAKAPARAARPIKGLNAAGDLERRAWGLAA